MPRLLPSLLLAASLLLAGGCRGDDEGVPMVAVIGDGAPAIGADEAAPETAAAAVLRGAVAQGLVRFDAAAQIEPGLAERWNVSDDGLSYIFRLQTGEWPDGRAIRARDVARLLTRQLRSADTVPVRDAAGAIAEVVAMTDRVIEIRLKAPRPNLLTLLAQPEFAIIRDGAGTGPFTIARQDEAGLRLVHRAPGFDGEPDVREEVKVQATPAAQGIAAFKERRAALLLGGTVADLPLARAAGLPRGALVFDPVAGLFGLVPGRRTAFTESAEVRDVLNQAIDRQALLAALAVPGLGPRATLLEGGLNGVVVPVQPTWLDVPVADRRGTLRARMATLLPEGAEGERPVVTIWAPSGPGGDMLVARLALDWGALGLAVERATSEARADFRFVDAVAPSDSPAWFVRRFRCDSTPICDEEVDRLTDEARATLLPQARAGLLAIAAQRVDGETLFMPITAPIRWSLVSRDVPGFSPNRYARHSLLGLASAPQGVR